MISLNAQQRAAVETESEKVLCLAGAGSGKTRVIVERAAFLIETKKVSPYEILAVTFTRKAALELKNRLEARVGSRARHMTVGTIHAVGLRYLRRFGELVGLKPDNITVYGEWEERFLLRETAADLSLYNGKSWKVPKGTIDEAFAGYYQKGVEPEEDHPAYGLFKEFIRRCTENNALTHGGILIGFDLLLPLIARYLNIKHLFVDEVQDIDPLQWQIIGWFKTFLGSSLFAVGDIDQSVYQWRGAVPEYLIEHRDEFDIYRLETNYRSCRQIVEAANRLIEHNERRLPRTMEAVRTEEGDILISRMMDSKRLAVRIKNVFGDHALGDLVVLARNHKLLDKIASELDAIDIPAVKIGRNHALMNTEEFRRFHAFLKLLVNPYDNFSFLLIRDLIGISRTEYADIRLRAAQEGESHFQIWIDSREDQDVLADFYIHNGDSTLQSILDELEEFFFDSEIFTIKDEQCRLNDSVAFIWRWLENNQNGTLSGYLDWLATYDIQDEIEEDDDRVKLMTVHASKGLEWPVVIVAGCNEGILPSKQSLSSGDVEAERRLMYVAMTRAEDSLILAVRPEQRKTKDGRVYNNPESRFVREAVPPTS